MKILQAIRKLIASLCHPETFVETGNDSHRWENKMELYQRLSSHHA
jgi:hypothetical protein